MTPERFLPEPERVSILRGNGQRSSCGGDVSLQAHIASIAAPGEHVLLWVQGAQRVRYNYALNLAAAVAQELRKPLVAVFMFDVQYPEANVRHFDFMLRGLFSLRDDLTALGIPLSFVEGMSGLVRAASSAALVITDRAYLRHTRRWREELALRAAAPLIEVETELLVPVEVASAKEEYSAATFRPRLMRRLPEVLATVSAPSAVNQAVVKPLPGALDDAALNALIASADDSVPRCALAAGERAAEDLLRIFIERKLRYYETLRNDPAQDYQSGLSPYLHFGQISSLQIAVAAAEAMEQPELRVAGEKFLDELAVRRELSFNFVFYNKRYDEYDAVPAWARKTLADHRVDSRSYIYDRAALEAAATHDVYWNAAQREMILTGKMHGYMRMYWGKKILEWMADPAEAHATALALNNRWSLDGRDPSSYAGVAWCFGKHDRPWTERRIFGMVRYMNDKGLERKFDIKAYARKWGTLSR